MKLSDIAIPTYSLGEELISAISHGAGALLSVAGLIVGVVYAAIDGDPYKIVSMAVFGTTLVLLYTMSCLYRSLTKNKAKQVFRILDHCTIFLLIAGTYTPYTLVSLRGNYGWILFAVIWAAAALGVILNAVNIKKFKVFSMVCYLAMGWVIVFAFNPLLASVDTNGILLLIGGGISYTIGAVLYGVGAKRKYFHSIWHFFVLTGSILHFFSILLYVIL